MKINQKQFRSFDVFAFTFCSTVTMGVAFLPFTSGIEVRNTWLKLMVGAVPFFIFLWLLYLFTQKYPDQDFFTSLKKYCHKGIYWVFMLYFIGSTLVGVSKEVNDIHVLMHTFLLRNTPKWTIILFFLLIVGVAVYYGIVSITRFVVLFVAIEALVVISVFLLGFGEAFNSVFIFPLWSADLIPFLKSTITDMARYGGIVALLGYIYYVKDDERIWKPTSMALASVMLLYISISIVIIGTFGFEHSVRLISPATALTQTITTESGLAERLDLFFLGFWIVSFFKIMSIHLWFTVFLVKKCWSQIHTSVILTICSTIVLLANMVYPVSLPYIWRFHDYNVLVYSLLLPCCLLIYLLIRKRKSEGAKDHG